MTQRTLDGGASASALTSGRGSMPSSGGLPLSPASRSVRPLRSVFSHDRSGRHAMGRRIVPTLSIASVLAITKTRPLTRGTNRVFSLILLRYVTKPIAHGRHSLLDNCLPHNILRRLMTTKPIALQHRVKADRLHVNDRAQILRIANFPSPGPQRIPTNEVRNRPLAGIKRRDTSNYSPFAQSKTEVSYTKYLRGPLREQQTYLFQLRHARPTVSPKIYEKNWPGLACDNSQNELAVPHGDSDTCPWSDRLVNTGCMVHGLFVR